MSRSRTACAAVLLALAGAAATPAVDAQVSYEGKRKALVHEVRRTAKLAKADGAPLISREVLEVIGKVPRHEFVPASQRDFAYMNRPLPIGGGQTISQPYIVALMTELAEVGPNDVVLEIGTGSGYQAAVLSELAREVYTIEIIGWLGERAADDLKRLDYDNVHVRIGDGYAGWPEHAPFEAIVVTAAPETVPQPLIDQLAVGGRMVIPVGRQGGVQMLRVLTKSANGDIDDERVIPVMFVPFTRAPEEAGAD